MRDVAITLCFFEVYVIQTTFANISFVAPIDYIHIEFKKNLTP